MKRILPFPRGRMKMTTVWNDDLVAEIRDADNALAEATVTTFEELLAVIETSNIPTRGDCGVVHDSFKERMDCAACNNALATNSRPWLYNDKSLSDFTRVVEETGVLDQKETQRRKQESKHD